MGNLDKLLKIAQKFEVKLASDGFATKEMRAAIMNHEDVVSVFHDLTASFKEATALLLGDLRGNPEVRNHVDLLRRKQSELIENALGSIREQIAQIDAQITSQIESIYSNLGETVEEE